MLILCYLFHNMLASLDNYLKVAMLSTSVKMLVTDAIFSLSGVSGAILKAAGNSVVDECKALGVYPVHSCYVGSGVASYLCVNTLSLRCVLLTRNPAK